MSTQPGIRNSRKAFSWIAGDFRHSSKRPGIRSPSKMNSRLHRVPPFRTPSLRRPPQNAALLRDGQLLHRKVFRKQQKVKGPGKPGTTVGKTARRGLAAGQSLRLSATRSTAISAGVIPVTRPACPRSTGRTRASFSRASARRWGTAS